MLGDEIYEARGKVTGVRVIGIEEGPNGVRTETSYTMQGKIKGIEITETGTFIAVMRSENKQYGEDKTVIMARDGSSTGTVRSWGISQATGPEKSSFRGFGICGQSNTGKLAAFNNMTIVFNTEVEGENLSAKGWEWK